MQFIGSLVILGFGLLHLGLGAVLLAMSVRTLRKELIPRLNEARPGPLNAAFTVFGGIGWTIAVALFCFLVAGRAMQMVMS